MTKRVDSLTASVLAQADLAGGSFMSFNFKEKKAAVRKVSKRYKRVSKKEKGRILNEFIKLKGCTKCYGSYVLRNFGKKTKININLYLICQYLQHILPFIPIYRERGFLERSEMKI